MTTDKSVPHALVADSDTLKGAGKDTSQPKPPIVALQPTAEAQGYQGWTPDKDKGHIVVDNPMFFPDLDEVEKGKYPFFEIEIGQALFIPVEPNMTTGKLMLDLNKRVNALNQRFGIREVDENGDEMLDQVTVETKKRNDDGTVQLRGDGSPIVGANFTQKPRMIPFHQFAVKSVAKGDKLSENQEAPHDGALIIRLA